MGALLSFKGELKVNATLCDLDGTPNVNGLYYKLTKKYSAIEAYKSQPLTIALYNVADQDNVTALTVLLDSLEPDDSNQLFTEKDESGNLIKQALYSEPLTGECLVKAQDFFDTRHNFITVDLEKFITADGEDYHVVPE